MINEKASKIKLLLLDVDGVMTDGRITINDRGEETKAFNVKDGLGLKMLMFSGLEVAIVTGRRSQALAHRSR
ncbi:MAG: phenylphosphate carboxylase subunit delta, partial [Desulfobacterales bacterium]